MAEQSAIEWTDATWNRWRGCTQVSPGCAHCYMYAAQRRYQHDPQAVVRCAAATFFAPVRSARWRRLAPGTRVFTCSWSDYFHESADPWRDEAWAVIRARPDLVWQILTKRPERIGDHLPCWWGEGPPNVWLGVSIENRRFVHRADLLRQVPAAIRFISAEPLLGPLDGLLLHDIDWLIVGGESGPRRRPMELSWARALKERAADAGCAFFFKQGSAARPGSLAGVPQELRVRQMPRVEAAARALRAA